MYETKNPKESLLVFNEFQTDPEKKICLKPIVRDITTLDQPNEKWPELLIA
jgi:hypothetical protein